MWQHLKEQRSLHKPCIFTCASNESLIGGDGWTVEQTSAGVSAHAAWPAAKLTTLPSSFPLTDPKPAIQWGHANSATRALGGALNTVSHQGACESRSGGSSQLRVMQKQWAASSKTVFWHRFSQTVWRHKPGGRFSNSACIICSICRTHGYIIAVSLTRATVSELSKLNRWSRFETEGMQIMDHLIGELI